MRYAMLICVEEKRLQAMTADESAAVTAKYTTFMEEMGQRSVIQGGERVRDGEVLTSDGPFAETKEQIGGYFIVDCKDLDEAVEIASKIPGAAHGTIEVRPIWEM